KLIEEDRRQQMRADEAARRASQSRQVNFSRTGGRQVKSLRPTHPWVKTNMTRTCGWCQRGEPLIAEVPHGHWKTLTFLAGLRRDSIVAPFVLDGPINGIAFTAWVRQCLVPTLKAGDIVILDNLGSHKGKPARDAIRDVGAHLFFLPPYSPDLNPIEMMFAKLKTLVRKADERTVETTWRRIGDLLKTFSPQECSNYLRHAGYGS
ncbi:transposase, partial [Rhizobium lentis]|nr:transposase [Rhizobium lentis]MBB5554242.1 transposase [Rhizobium lentis]MBB5564880.1 transposase [Rhizobium lentis]MBB5571386.1 transposase [Rhizobium lentis]